MKRWIFPIGVLAVVLLLTPVVHDLASASVPDRVSSLPTATPVPGFTGDRVVVSESGHQTQPAPSDSAPGQFQGSIGQPSAQAASGSAIPTPVAPLPGWVDDAQYEIKNERVIGSYVIRVWQNLTGESLLGFDGVVTIQSIGQPVTQIEMASGWHELTGTDITGEGNPDLVVETYSGGAHCCFSTIVYDLGPVLTEVLRTPESNCSGYFEDLDADGSLEFITCDDLFSYVYCCFAGSPAAKVIMKYYPGEGYLPASTKFGSQYTDDIAKHTKAAEQAMPSENCEWDETTKCTVLPVVLDYLYSGQWDTAWSELERLYPYDDRETFKEEIIRAVGASALYTFP